MTAGYVLALKDIDRTHAALAGGKAAHLGELMRIEGVVVPDGFCVTTSAFRRFIANAASVADQIERLSQLRSRDGAAIRAPSMEIRNAIGDAGIPDDVMAAITAALEPFGEQAAWAVRSSATAEDLPAASFAGQHDSYLHVVGTAAVLDHVRRCWASLFTDRAVIYRLQHDVDHGDVAMAVVVQRMLQPRAAGVLFTADPVTGNRKVATVEATRGTGEALVSGTVDADAFTVRDDEVVDRRIGRRDQPALAEAQVVRLVQLGRRIEAHFGTPQDIEWCLVDDDFQVVQSRPITTLFPIPARDDQERHVYISVGHQQMMTDPMKPLGISLWQLTAARPMYEAGGRLFVDVIRELESPASRAALLEAVGRADPLIGDALETIIARGFVASHAGDGPPPPPGTAPIPAEIDPAVVGELIARSEASIAALEREISGKSGVDLLARILADIEELKRSLFEPQSFRAIMAGMQATWWLNERLHTWLGEKNAVDALTQSVPNNVTSEMGLALMDVADAIRPYPEVVAFLQHVTGDGFLDELPRVAGGIEAQQAIRCWLGKYGMRCVGEIDITRPRWSERPSMLIPLILGNVRNFEAGEGIRRFEQGRLAAAHKRQELLDRLRSMPDGERLAHETARMIDQLRAFIGYREYPKYAMVSRYFVYRKALLHEAGRLVERAVLREADDIFYLTFAELHEVVRTQRADDRLIHQRRDAFRSYDALTPPRVLTSDGEALSGAYRRAGVPAAALVGLAVSAGTSEGRARVVRDIADAELERGDILVTTFTDPSWTPLFVTIGGLVAEVGGLMTHGSVIAREYGVPAVVGVERATQRIRDGQRIRVHGADGYVELLD